VSSALSAIPGLQVFEGGQVPADYGRWLIAGTQGAGKSTLASTVATLGKTLYIDMPGEKGTRAFLGSPYVANIDVVRPASVKVMDDLFWHLDGGKHDYAAVVIDSISSLQRMALRYLTGSSETTVKEIEKGGRGADQQTWGRALDIMSDVATFWFGLADASRARPMHVVMVAQPKIMEDQLSGSITWTLDVQKGAISAFLACPDYVLWCDTEPNPDAPGDENASPVRHVVRFGANPSNRAKARVPMDLWGKIPPVLGRNSQTNLGVLSKILRVGGAAA